jgi:hypothetical protein
MCKFQHQRPFPSLVFLFASSLLHSAIGTKCIRHMDFKLSEAIRMLLHVCHPGASVCVGVKVELSLAFIVFASFDKYCSCALFIPPECKLQS